MNLDARAMSSKILKRQLKNVLSSDSDKKSQPEQISKHKKSKRDNKESQAKTLKQKDTQSYEARLQYFRATMEKTEASRKAALAMQKVPA